MKLLLGSEGLTLRRIRLCGWMLPGIQLPNLFIIQCCILRVLCLGDIVASEVFDQDELRS